MLLSSVVDRKSPVTYVVRNMPLSTQYTVNLKISDTA